MICNIHSYSGCTVFAAARAISACLPQAIRGVADIVAREELVGDDAMEVML